MAYGIIANQTPQVDAFTKDQTLQSATAALYGLSGETALPDNVFQQIKNLIDAVNISTNSKCAITLGSYIGTGTNSHTISLPVRPKILMIMETDGLLYSIIAIDGMSNAPIIANYDHNTTTLSWNNTQLTLSGSSQYNALNNNKSPYLYALIY